MNTLKINQGKPIKPGSQLVIFDLDATLRNNLNSGVYVPKDTSKTENWLVWQSYVIWHSPIMEHMCNLYKLYVNSEHYDVWILTASTFGTEAWLNRVGLPQPNRIEERPLDFDGKPMDFKKEFVEERLAGFSGVWIDDDTTMCNWIHTNRPNCQVLTVKSPY